MTWLIAAAGLLGCQQQSRTVRTVTLPGEDAAANPQRAVVEAPADLHDISGYLLRYRVQFGAYPDSLATLQSAGIMPKQGFEGLGAYAYHPQGLGTLANGHKIMVVDRTLRIADHVWCILEIDRPSDVTAALDVRLVPWADLQQAARSAPR